MVKYHMPLKACDMGIIITISESSEKYNYYCGRKVGET